MPNWCNNTLTLNDNSNDSILEVVKNYLDSGHLSLEMIRPIPKELHGTISPTPKDIDPNEQKMLIEKYGHDNWYDWCVDNWGTKWECEVHYSDEKAISFTTAWSPPIGAIKTLAILTGRDFRLTYVEEGMDFCGEYFAYKNYLENQDCEYSPIEDAPDELKEEILGEEWKWEDSEDEEK